jgi:hypothetical protein
MISRLVLLAVGLGVRLAAQAPELAPVAEQARKALAGHDVSALLGASTRVLVQLPAAAPSAPVGKAHAEALIKAYLADFEEVATEIRGTNRSGERSATVELRRSYRVPGTTVVKRQSVLLAYQLVDGNWILSEIRITG